MTIDSLEEAYRKVIAGVGEDLNREGLKATPERAAKAMAFLTHGYHLKLEDVINNAIFSSEANGIVIVKNIELYSLCEHHLLPFIGKCHIGYIPNGKVLGLSKFARLVDFYARRLQIQENLTKQIAETIMNVTGALGVGVIIEAKHLCMMMRGVEKQNSVMSSSVMLGCFLDDESTRKEFLQIVNHRVD